MSDRGERLFVWLTRLYPREFRAQYLEDLVAFYQDDRAHPRYGTGALRPVRFWMATLRDLVRTAWGQRRARRQVAGASTHAGRRNIGRLREDIRDAWRSLHATPGVTAAALLVLTLGIGAGTAIFSLVDAVVLRGLPFDDAHRIVRVSETDLETGRVSTVAPQNYLDWLPHVDLYESIGAISGAPGLVTVEEPIETLRAMRVTASLFEVLRVAPVRGRSLAEADEQPGAPPVALISDDLWRRRFNADPAVVGRTILSSAGEVHIVGVMPPGFTYPVSVTAVRSSTDLWMPFVWTDNWRIRPPGGARTYTFSVVARLKPGVSIEDAAARMTAIRDRLALRHPKWFVDRGVDVALLRDAIVGASVRSWMFLLLSAVGVVMLMACLNAAHLLVARAVTRGPELAVRAALGARRADLARALLVESLLLSLLGAAGGVLVALWGVEILRSTLPGAIPRLADVAVDLRVLLVAIAAALVSGTVFGTIPALYASRPDVVTLLGQAGRGSPGSRPGRRLRAGLVVAEVGLAVVLLSAATLFVASYRRVTAVELGFDPTNVMSVLGGIIGDNMLVPGAVDEHGADVRSRHAQVAELVARVRAVPGVIAVAPMQGGTPLSGNRVTVPVDLPDGRRFSDDDEPNVRSVGSAYLDVLGATMARGRWIGDSDDAGSNPVVVLNEDAARRYFGSADPIGAHILLKDVRRTVIGVVHTLRWRGPESDPSPEVFIPFAQTTHPTAQLLVRTASDPGPLVPSIEAAIRTIVPRLAALNLTRLDERYAALIAQRKFNMVVLVMFGAAAIAIAAIGIYALMAFVVAQRRREIGVRVALGAVPSGILSLVLGGALRLLVAGLIPGLIAAVLLERSAQAFLFNARPHDPAVYAAVALVLLAAGSLAAIGPARRATRVDPLTALRGE